jgi:hypothetical protein
MALVEAVLTYRPQGVGEEIPAFPLGKTAHVTVLRALRDQLLQEAIAETRLWEGVDPGVAAIRAAEVERLASILAALLPDEEPQPDIYRVK